MIWHQADGIYLHLVSKIVCCSITHLPWNHGQGVNTNTLPSLTRVLELHIFEASLVDIEQGLDSILTNSMKTPELDASFDKPNIMTSSELLCLASTISDHSKLWFFS